MSTADLLSEFASSGEFYTVDPQRTALIDARHQLLGELMREQGLDGILLSNPANFAWFTVGGDSTRGSWNDAVSSLFVTPEARVVLSRNTDSTQLFDRQIPGLGFQLKERVWTESREVLMGDICRARNVACDQPFENCPDISPHLAGLRLPLADQEMKTLVRAGAILAHAVEATARGFHRGETEAEVAGQIAHRLLRHSAMPVRIQVWADGQGERYRHWGFGEATIEQFCTLTAVARLNGLHVGVSRTVCFGTPTKEVRAAHLDCLLVEATGIFFSQRQWEIFETWNRVERIYDKFGHTEEWHFSDQGCVTGYELCEAPIAPRSEYRLQAGVPVYWHSSIGPALVSDTVLVTGEGVSIVTRMENWPKVEIDVKGVKLSRPDILIRPE
jgi:Xaa-Pro dipeptidase